MKKVASLAAALLIPTLCLIAPAQADPFETATPGSTNSNRYGVTPLVGKAAPGLANPKVSAVKSNGINFNGGPVMTATTGVNIYIIWYGNWTNNSGLSLVPTFINGLSGSAYYNINTTYYDSAKNKVVNSLRVAGQVTDSYSVGSTNLTDANIQSIVNSALTSNALPTDANGIYLVLTSADVTKQGFLTNYCGWHTHATMNSADIKYSFVGNPGTSTSCGYRATSPNNNGSVDAMVSVIAHEIEEAVTDPDLNAWYDNRGQENADKCAWTFGTTYTTTNGATANMKLGGLDWLVQRNWVNANGGYCATSY